MSSKLATIAAASAAAVLALVVGGVQATSGGYIAAVQNTTNTAGSAQAFSCVEAGLRDAATFAYLFTSTANSTLTDSSGNNRTGTYLNTKSTASAVTNACRRDDPGAYVLTGLTGGTNSFAISPQLANPPTTFSLELWFKTASTSSYGQLMGFGSSNDPNFASLGLSRELYMSTSGNLVFGVSPLNTMSSPLTYRDTAWHQVIVTVSATQQVMYVDGASVVTNNNPGTALPANAYWHFGFDSLLTYPGSHPTNNAFTGSFRFAALYPTTLSATAVTNHYRAGSPAP